MICFHDDFDIVITYVQQRWTVTYKIKISNIFCNCWYNYYYKIDDVEINPMSFNETNSFGRCRLETQKKIRNPMFYANLLNKRTIKKITTKNYLC